nr:Tetratricopeptide repeat protein [Leptospira interrogans serovar Copenhageni/Icterohaemorrhagiae]
MISEAMKQTIQFYNEGLNLYKTRKFTEALEKFKKAIELTPDDGPSKKIHWSLSGIYHKSSSCRLGWGF